MVGVTEISALLASLKGVKDIAQAMVGLRDEAAFFKPRLSNSSRRFWTPKALHLRLSRVARRWLIAYAILNSK